MTLEPLQSLDDLMAPPTQAGRAALVEDAGLADGPGIEWLLDQAEERLHLDPTTAEAALARRRAPGRRPRSRGRRGPGPLPPRPDPGRAGRPGRSLSRASCRHGPGSRPPARRSRRAHRPRPDADPRRPRAPRRSARRRRGAPGRRCRRSRPAAPTTRRSRRWSRPPRGATAESPAATSACTQRSLAAYERAEQGYAALGMVLESAQWQANRGVELLSLGSAEEAAEALTRAAAGFEAAGDLLWSAKCEGDLAQADHLRGNLVARAGAARPCAGDPAASSVPTPRPRGSSSSSARPTSTPVCGASPRWHPGKRPRSPPRPACSTTRRTPTSSLPGPRWPAGRWPTRSASSPPRPGSSTRSATPSSPLVPIWSPPS